MKPNHHLDDSTLLAYAAGTLDEAFSVVAASHVAVCPACRGAVRVAVFDVKLPASARGQLKLLRIGAGRAMPEHGHGGEEITMVLMGAYVDHMGRFAAGDVADLDEDIEHRPVVEQDGDCICLVATERPTRFKSLAARIMQPFVGI